MERLMRRAGRQNENIPRRGVDFHASLFLAGFAHVRDTEADSRRAGQHDHAFVRGRVVVGGLVPPVSPDPLRLPPVGGEGGVEVEGVAVLGGGEEGAVVD